MDKIEIRCPSCNRLLRTPISAAGQNAKCPACGQIMQLPEASMLAGHPPVYDAEDVPPDPYAGTPTSPFAADFRPKSPSDSSPVSQLRTSVDPFAAPDPSAQDPFAPKSPFASPEGNAGESSQRRPCPACGEQIPLGAARCHYCGEIFDPRLRHQEFLRQGGASETGLEAIDWVLCILCTWVGCIVGIVYLIQGKPKGAKMIGFSILFTILEQMGWFVLQLVFAAGAAGF